MKASFRFCSVSLALILAGSCPLALAQSTQTTQKQETGKTIVINTGDGAVGGWSGAGADTFFYVGSEMALEHGVVKGAPYSAQGTTTFTQTLGDGNRINRQTTSQIYRDSEGRTRREETIGAIGPWASGTDAVQMIHINDPVAGTAFMLNPKDRTASKMTIRISSMTKTSTAVGTGTGVGAGGGTGVGVAGDAMTVHVGPMPPPPPGGPMLMPGRMPAERFSVEQGQVNKESLGTQMIEGVQAEGTRATYTIPAGQIGNDQPIQVVSERWYSPDLQVVVMTTHSDPRTGVQTYKLGNINRSEPAHQLFEIPADYTVKESGDLMRTFKYDVHTSADKKQNEQ